MYSTSHTIHIPAGRDPCQGFASASLLACEGSPAAVSAPTHPVRGPGKPCGPHRGQGRRQPGYGGPPRPRGTKPKAGNCSWGGGAGPRGRLGCAGKQ